MMRVSLVSKKLLDKCQYCGASRRLEEDIRQLKLEDMKITIPIPGFKDCGLINYNGELYYMSTYEPSF